MQPLSPRESGVYIATEAKHVSVLEGGVKELSKKIARHLQDGSLHLSGFSQHEFCPSMTNEMIVNWIFLVDTLNFCFWSSSDKKWSVTWRCKTYTGYLALCAAINRAVDEGYPITDPKYYCKVSLEDLKNIFRGDDLTTNIPLLNDRQKCLHEVGMVLNEKFGGMFNNCIHSCKNSAEKLLEIIINNFSCYKDEALYNSVKVSFYKRAQILIGDIWATFQGKSLGYFTDIEKLTMFADYRVPQVLLHFGAILYSNELMDTLKRGKILPHGSQEEVEIRGCSIHAVELIMKEIKLILPGVKTVVDDNDDNSVVCNSVLIDYFLWDYRRQHAEKLAEIPFHKTLSIYY